MKSQDKGVVCLISAIFGIFAATYFGWRWHFFTVLGILFYFYKPKNDPKDLSNIFRQTGLVKKSGDLEEVPRIISQKGDTTLLTLPVGLSSRDFERKALAVSEALNATVDFKYHAGKIVMTVTKEKLQTLYQYEPVALGAVEIPIGHTLAGLKTLSFDGSYSNLLVGGLTRWGKSAFLRQALTNLIINSPSRLYLMDLKYGVEFDIFQPCRTVAGFATNEAEVRDSLEQIEKEIRERFHKFQKAGVSNIQDYNKRQNEMEHYIVVVDEYADLRDYGDIQERIDRIIRIGGGAGFHSIICTQRPSAETVRGTIKANIPVTLAFRTRNALNSRILLDSDDAAYLEYPGRAIYQTDQNQEVQVMFLEKDRARELVRPFYTKKESPKPKPKKGVLSLEEYTRFKDH